MTLVAEPAPVPVPAAEKAKVHRPEEAPDGRSRKGFVRRHRLLFIALILVLVFHGSLLLAGSYQRTYDAYVHIFFADHYARDWFSSWDTRWYTGFSTLSYPPGGHFLIAALSKIIGLRPGFVVVQVFALLNLTIGVYRWSGIWVNRTSAGWAAIALVLASSIAETVHVFGQLPTTLSLGFLLNGLPFANTWVRTGNRKALLAGVGCIMATTACHHVTTLFGSLFFLGPVLLGALVFAVRTPLAGEKDGHPPRFSFRLLWPLIARRIRRVMPSLVRTGILGALVVTALLCVVLPYWLYSKSDPITQVSIPHASRDNFLVNVNAGLVFWLVPWGTTLLVLPYALIRGMAGKAWPLTLSLGVLAFLGTGGTTPFPKILLGGAYDILTLDRFTFWATISILPLVGQFISSVTNGSIRAWLLAHVGRTLSVVLPALLLAAHLTTTLYAANLTQYRAFQPAPIDVTPITTFMDKDQHSQWRYLTLGFGDQMAWLGANMTAGTVDGDYHSARQLPELTSRPIERLEGAKYSGVPGIGSLQQFLAVPGRYSLKYVFSNDAFYSPLLDASGWTDLGPLENGIEIWERSDVAPLPTNEVSHQAPLWERLWWGLIPPASIALALMLMVWSLIGAPTRAPGVGAVARRLVPARLRRMLSRPPRAVAHLVRSALKRLTSPVTRAVGTLDAALARASDRIPHTEEPAPPAGGWLPWGAALPRLRTRARARVRKRRRRWQAAVVTVMLVLVAAGGALAVAKPRQPTAAEVVEDYYGHLDFRRFAAAYALLDPSTRPDYTVYQQELGRDGGLVASFAKLASVTAVPASSTPGRQVMTATLDYLTSLQSYRVTSPVTLIQEPTGWFIDLPAADATSPPDQFTSRPAVGFLSQGRRALSSDGTSTMDVLDRPELTLGNVSSLLVNGRWVVIGEVTNTDVDPADVTVEAQLRDPDGALLASWDASQVLVHKLLPGATSPFRIEFQSIAGTGDYGLEADGGLKNTTAVTPPSATSVTVAAPATSSNIRGPVEFDPQTITPFVLAAGAKVSSVAVYARAVVTPRASARGLQVQHLRLTGSAADGYAVVGELRNDGTVEAAVPHLLVSYTAADGSLAWVDHAYLEHSIAPQSVSDFRIPLASSTPIAASGVATTGYAGPAHSPPVSALAASIALPADTGFSGLSLTATTYARASQP
ncbi:hypothetical protein [Cryobacterium zhongshanensis]|uniref:Membrane protein 6-pyruvoyl-tetrahydropterin synthase-related domain-containing protein n=1 Tax=Cryobacterium zhongshanensis TaxID=2928153 RepID=A0AA41QX37_9MICO|nr:hypothetical protein [Cryobacterium zhongshanensis]MCI4658965.1 hypothetical protein [Cryobacterium zhongshanensis]